MSQAPIDFATDDAKWESSGSFSLDPAKALSRMQSSLNSAPEAAALHALIAARSRGATRIGLRYWGTSIFHIGLRIFDNAPALRLEEGEKLVRADLSMSEPSLWLFRALQAGRQVGATYFSGRLQLHWAKGRLHCSRSPLPLGDVFGRNLFHLPGGHRYRAFLSRLLSQCLSPEIHYQGQKSPGRVQVPDDALGCILIPGVRALTIDSQLPAERVWTVEAPSKNSGVIWLLPSLALKSRLLLLKEGIPLEWVEVEPRTRPWGGVVWSPDLGHDLSGRFRRDESFQTLLQFIETKLCEHIELLPQELRQNQETLWSIIPQEAPSLPLIAGATTSILSPDGLRLATASLDQLRLWGLRNQRWEMITTAVAPAHLPEESGAGRFCFSSDSKLLLVGDHRRTYILEAREGSGWHPLDIAAKALTFLPFDRRACILNYDGELVCYDPLERTLSTLTKVDVTQGHLKEARLECSPTGQWLAVIQWGCATLIEFQTPTEWRTVTLNYANFHAFLPGGEGILTSDVRATGGPVVRRFSNLHLAIPTPLSKHSDLIYRPPLVGRDRLYFPWTCVQINLENFETQKIENLPIQNSSTCVLIGDDLCYTDQDGVWRFNLRASEQRRSIASTKAQSLDCAGEEWLLVQFPHAWEVHNTDPTIPPTRLESGLSADFLTWNWCDGQLQVVASTEKAAWRWYLPEGRLESSGCPTLFLAGHLLLLHIDQDEEIILNEGQSLRGRQIQAFSINQERYVVVKNDGGESLYAKSSGEMRSLPSGKSFKVLTSGFVGIEIEGQEALEDWLELPSFQSIPKSLWPVAESSVAYSDPFILSKMGLFRRSGESVRAFHKHEVPLGFDSSGRWIFVQNRKRGLLQVTDLKGRVTDQHPVPAGDVSLRWGSDPSRFLIFYNSLWDPGARLRGQLDINTGQVTWHPCNVRAQEVVGKTLLTVAGPCLSFYSWEEQLLGRLFFFEGGLLAVDPDGGFEALGHWPELALGKWRQQLHPRPGLLKHLCNNLSTGDISPEHFDHGTGVPTP